MQALASFSRRWQLFQATILTLRRISQIFLRAQKSIQIMSIVKKTIFLIFLYFYIIFTETTYRLAGVERGEAESRPATGENYEKVKF